MGNEIDDIKDRLGWYESVGNSADMRFLIGELINICDAMSPFLDEREIDKQKDEKLVNVTGDLAQALINIQNLLKNAPQSAWVSSVLDICRDTLAGNGNDFNLQSQIEIANKTINQFSNEMVRLKAVAWEVVGESGLNGSIENLKKVLEELEGKEVKNGA